MLLAAVGAETAESADVLAALQRLAVERLGQLRAQTRTYPGVEALLARLAAAGVRQTVVTGNIAAVARRQARGGRADPPDRARLRGSGWTAPRVAPPSPRWCSTGCRRPAGSADSGQVWIVGQILRDLACARAVGVRCALAATGRATVGERTAWGRTSSLPDLSDPRPLHPLWHRSARKQCCAFDGLCLSRAGTSGMAASGVGADESEGDRVADDGDEGADAGADGRGGEKLAGVCNAEGLARPGRACCSGRRR